MENLSGMLIPIGTLALIFLVQISFWFPMDNKQQQSSDASSQKSKEPPTAVDSKADDRRAPPRSRGFVSKRITAENDPSENVSCFIISSSDEASSSGSEGTLEPPRDNNTKGNNNETTTTSIPNRKVWKCACEYMPAGLLKTFGNAEAMMRLGIGQCYHKK